MNELITIKNSAQLVQAHKIISAKVKQALDLLIEAKAMSRENFGEYTTLIPREFSDNSLSYRPEQAFTTIQTQLKKNFWSTIADKTEIRKILSIKRQQELSHSIYDEASKLPEPTDESLWEFLQSNMGKAKDFVQEAVIEVFNFLRPRKGFNYNKFKTNQVETIGDVVKIDNVVSTGLFQSLSYHYKRDIQAIDSLFHMLDNKSVSESPNDLCTKIEQSIRDGSMVAETEYFRVKSFKKGSIHIYFKRLDLVAKINQIAGKSFLK